MNTIDPLFQNPFVAGVSRLTEDHPAPIYRPYGMERWILNLTVGGKGRINSGNKLFYVNRQDLLLFPAGVPHDYGKADSAVEWEHIWVYFEPKTEWMPLLKWPENHHGITKLTVENKASADQIEVVLMEVVASYNSHFSRKLAFCQNYLEQALLWIDSVNPGARQQIDDRILRALELIEKKFSSDLKVANIARECGMSESRFAHLFQECLGTSPIKYLQARRIETARKLLISQNCSINEAADKVGFNDPLYFSKVFKKMTGQNPRSFRTGG